MMSLFCVTLISPTDINNNHNTNNNDNDNDNDNGIKYLDNPIHPFCNRKIHYLWIQVLWFAMS